MPVLHKLTEMGRRRCFNKLHQNQPIWFMPDIRNHQSTPSEFPCVHPHHTHTHKHTYTHLWRRFKDLRAFPPASSAPEPSIHTNSRQQAENQLSLQPPHRSNTHTLTHTETQLCTRAVHLYMHRHLTTFTNSHRVNKCEHFGLLSGCVREDAGGADDMSSKHVSTHSASFRAGSLDSVTPPQKHKECRNLLMLR